MRLRNACALSVHTEVRSAVPHESSALCNESESSQGTICPPIMGGQACATTPGFLHGSGFLYFIDKAISP